MKVIIPIIILLILLAIGLSINNETKITVYQNVKVLDKQQQQLIKKETTDYRYLVITDKGTFICDSSLVNGKFNNSDLFWHIQKDSAYNFKVCGVGKGILFDYQNIIEIVN